MLYVAFMSRFTLWYNPKRLSCIDDCFLSIYSYFILVPNLQEKDQKTTLTISNPFSSKNHRIIQSLTS